MSKSNKKETEQCAIPSVSHSFKVGDVVELDVYGEICCDLCNEIIHNHIDCPVCESDYAETDQYCDLYDETQLTCEDCGTVFEKVSDKSWYYDCKTKIVSLNCG
jgi:hypothetical protein